jgi:hypothetical protein
MKTFTFKKQPFSKLQPDTSIKLNKKIVGVISSAEYKWTVRFTVKTDGGCGWKWIALKARFDNEPDAREFIERNAERLASLNLHDLDY